MTGKVAVNTGGLTGTGGHLKAGSHSGIESVSELSGADKANDIFADLRGDYTVSPRDNILWIGGNGDWSTPSNWFNNILPTTGNVLSATIPTGVTVTYDATAGDTHLDSLSSQGHFLMTGGNLGLSGDFSTAQYTQSGGTLSATSFNVNEAFNQTDGVIKADYVTIKTVNELVQGALGSIQATNLIASSSNEDVTLAGLNSISGTLGISAGSDIYSRTEGGATISYLNAPDGWIDVENKGGLVLGSTPLNEGTTVANASGDIMIKTKSPLTVNGLVSSTEGSITLATGDEDTLTVNAPLSASNGLILTGGKLAGSKAASYIQYFNASTSVEESTLTDSITAVNAVVVGTTQPQQPLLDDSFSNNSSDESTESSSDNGKKGKQCAK